MHTIEIGEYRFHFNSDNSGDVFISRSRPGRADDLVAISFSVLEKFVLERRKAARGDSILDIEPDTMIVHAGDIATKDELGALASDIHELDEKLRETRQAVSELRAKADAEITRAEHRSLRDWVEKMEARLERTEAIHRAHIYRCHGQYEPDFSLGGLCNQCDCNIPGLHGTGCPINHPLNPLEKS